MRRRIRKFAHRQADREQSENKQTDSSKTEATLILCGSSGERANTPPGPYIANHSHDVSILIITAKIL